MPSSPGAVPHGTPQEHLTRVLEGYYAAHGDTPLGVAWTRPELVPLRHDVMLDLVRHDPRRVAREDTPVELLDVGCGAGHFYDHLTDLGLTGGDSAPGQVRYAGIDTSQTFVDLCRSKYPDLDIRRIDILASTEPLPTCDYAVANGVLTIRAGLDWDDMWAYTQEFVVRMFSMARHGIAFNVMSTHLDWERDDLFHVPFDTMAGFVRARLSRRFAFRQDYGAYEYTTYVYRDEDVT